MTQTVGCLKHRFRFKLKEQLCDCVSVFYFVMKLPSSLFISNQCVCKREGYDWWQLLTGPVNSLALGSGVLLNGQWDTRGEVRRSLGGRHTCRAT